MPGAWKDEIFKQKGLWEVYRLSRRVLPQSRANRVAVAIAATILFGIFSASVVNAPELYTPGDAVQFLRKIAEQSFVLALSILGFLIAGFAIFASVTKAELFIVLANITYKKTEINRLQFVFFNFLNVFTIYIFLLAFSLMIQFLVAADSPALGLSRPHLAHCPRLAVGIGNAVSLIFCIWIVVAVLRLKSFIWNLYQTVLVTIATEDEMNAARKKPAQTEQDEGGVDL